MTRIPRFGDSDRFRIDGQLGEGGFGVVYKAFDRNRGQHVALKTLRNFTPASLLYFKREFRALTDLIHPNLVRLYDLFSVDDEWFFTMELVEGGRNILEFVWDEARNHEIDEAATQVRQGAQTLQLADIVAAQGATETVPICSPADPQRLRSSLRQLAEAVNAVHGAGKLHRDIKPSNVLVTRAGRIILLDFGLVTNLSPEPSASMHIAGTPAYMSPEQLAGGTLSVATDWYSVGVLLYQALTGGLPFSGNYLHLVAEKQRREPPMPASIVTGVPSDLNAICIELLRIDPSQRLAGSNLPDLLPVSEHSSDSFTVVAGDEGSVQTKRLVGREQELAALRQAFDDVRRGSAIVFCIEGMSGVGKSALARHFVAKIRREAEDVVVLSGRCYKRESVPYKAIDSVVDDLSRFLNRLPRLEAEALMPRDAPALARLFPVLRQVENLMSVRRRQADLPDAHEMRRRAFTAFRELLTRIADQRPLVIVLDDLQWGDTDSAALLRELLRQPDAPSALVIACYRSDELEGSLFLPRLFAADVDLGTEIRKIALHELTEEDGRLLTAALLRAAGDVREDAIDHIVREASGSPLFIDQLVRFARSQPTAVSSTEPSAVPAAAMTLADMIRHRVKQLPADARHILELVALNGKPLIVNVVRVALTMDVEPDDSLAILRSEHLIRSRDTERGDEIDSYHDRIRETVAATIPTIAAQQYHLRLALALESASGADPELLAEHFAAAGERERAGVYALAGAVRAHEALAFDRAARLYQIAVDLATMSDEERRGIERQRGDALASAGRGQEAAGAYLYAARGGAEAERLDLERRAAEQLLLSGHIDEGLRVLRQLLMQIGMRLPRSPITTILSLIRYRVQLRLRGLDFQRRSESELPLRDLVRVDACWSVGIGLAMTDPLRASVFQTKNLLMSLSLGEPYRISRSLAIATGFHSIHGGKARRQARSLAMRASELSDEVTQPHAKALVQLFESVIAWELGEWQKSLDLAERSEDLFRTTCTGVAWELATSQIFELASLVWLGRWREHSSRLPELIMDAEQRGDLYAAISLPLLSYSYSLFLAADDTEGGRADIAKTIARWSAQGFHLQHYWAIYGEVEIDLYEGDGVRAWARVGETERNVRRSLLLQVQTVSIFHHFLRARAALAAAKAGAETQLLLREAMREVRTIEREKMEWGNALAKIIRASLPANQQKPQTAIALLHSAEESLERAEMKIFRDSVRRRRGELIGGEDGERLIRESEKSMREENVAVPEKLARVFVPQRL
jgi:hypothetical protein